LYVNAGRELSAVTGGFEACPANDAGWRIDKNSNVRVQNLVLEGQGTATDGLGYGLMVIQDGDDEFVGLNLDIFYTGYHAFGHIGVGGERNVATVINVNAGLCVNRGGTGAAGSGDITVFVSYAGFGEAEYYQYECTARYGALPSSDWKAVPGLRHGSALYTHTNGDQWTQSLMLCWKTGADLCVNPVKSINILGAPRPATDIADARAFIVEDQPGRIASWWQQPGIVAINCIRDLTKPPQGPGDGPFVGLNYGTLTIAGWLINCTLTVDAALFSVNEYVAVGTYGSSTQYINCHFEIRNANNPVSFHHTWLDPVQVSAGLKLTNSIISFSTVNGARTALALNNSPGTLRSNAYYLPNLPADPALGYSGDAGAIVLPRPFPAGLVPSEFSTLFNAGAPNGLEYDQRRQPRGPLRTIGPLTGTASPIPRAGFVVAGQGEFDISDDPVLALATARQIQLRFDEPVETGLTALQLVGPGNVGIPLSSLSYSADRKTVTFHTLAALEKGRYHVSFAGQPVGQFRVLPGDFTGDGKVDTADFLMFRLNFLGTNLTFDIDGDGHVDTRDFLILRQNFLASL
jgi:hypothetical protein